MDVRPKHRPGGTSSESKRTIETVLDLPVELLLQIFSYLDVKSLGRLGLVSRRLRLLSRDDVSWSRLLQHSPALPVLCPAPSDAFPPPTGYDLARVSNNWQTGTFEAQRVVSFRGKEIPRLRTGGSQRQDLYSSRGRVVEKRPLGPKRRRDTEIVFQGFVDDVADFVVDTGRDRLIAGCRDGSVGSWPLEDEAGDFSRTERYDVKWKGKKTTKSVAKRFANRIVKNAHDGDVHAVAARDDVVWTGSRDTFVKVWRFRDSSSGHRDGESGDDATLLTAVPTGDRVWSLACAPEGAAFASGTAGVNGIPALRLWSAEGGRFLGALGDPTHARNGAGILHLHFETPHSLVSAGYDTCLRVWDLRSWSRALELEDPHDDAVYCACSDERSPLIVTGTARHAVVNVWDRRKAKAPLRMIYVNHINQVSSSSPVYSLAVDWNRLYAAYDLGISSLDFGIYRGVRQFVKGSYSYSHRDEAG